MQDLIEDLANLFPQQIKEMADLDAADFKDKSVATWDLVQRAREIAEEYS